MDELSLLRSMLLIRAFEGALLRHPGHGFQLLSSGQEAVAVGVCAALTPDDQLLASGRSIAAALARGQPPRAVMGELLGKTAGPCGGRGGRGHLAQPDAGFFGAHAVVGGNLTIAAGVALAMQMQRRNGIVACLFGDGACASGALHETLNIAALWRLPLLLVCDNNGYSISTPVAAALVPAPLSSLAVAFGIRGATVDGMDVIAVRAAAGELAAQVRGGGGPAFLECRSARFASHSTLTRETRDADELAADLARCPIRALAGRLEGEGSLTPAERVRLSQEAEDAAEAAIRFADAAPYPDAADLLFHVG
jgi:TPP-dependent pyruvate/acetoin dehydrogenase alpha subunit